MGTIVDGGGDLSGDGIDDLLIVGAASGAKLRVIFGGGT
jgi:hypothetical protein